MTNPRKDEIWVLILEKAFAKSRFNPIPESG